MKMVNWKGLKVIMNDISSQWLYHVIECGGDYDDYNQVTLYIFTDEEAAMNKIREFQKKDKEEYKLLKKKGDQYTKKLCDKYDITDKSQYDVIDKIYDLATEEEIDNYDRLYYNIMGSSYKNKSYCVYKYKVGKGNKVEEFDSYHTF